MQKTVRIVALFFLVFMLLFQLPSAGQNKKFFVITGKIVPEVETTEKGIIEMSKSGSPVERIEIPKNGRFRLELEYFKEYTLTFMLSGFFNKKIIVSTEIPQEVWKRDSDFPPFPMVVQLFKEIEGIDKSFTLKPAGKIFYGKQTDNFEKESYFSDVQIAEQISTAKAQSGQVVKEAQTITKQEALDLAAKQKNFDQLIKDADGLYQRGEYQLALLKYLEAKKLFPDKAYANDRIAELQDLVKALEITQKQKAELDQKYKDAIARANGFFDKKSYQEARPVYEEALQYKPGDVFSNGRINEIDQLLALLEKQKQYNDLIAQADNNYKSKNYDQAITIYNQARQLVPDNAYPQKQVDLINQEKQQLAKIELQEKEFDQNIQAGDKLTRQKDFLQAINSYRKALEVKPGNKLASEKIAETEQAIAAIETDKKYQETIKAADQTMDANDLQKAKMQYLEALKIKSGEKYPNEKIRKIDEALAEREKLQQTENEFQALVGKGDAAFSQNDYETAKTNYTNALSLKSNASEVKSKIKNIENLLQKIADDKKKEENRLLALAAANEKAYNSAIDKGNKLIAQKTYTEARGSFQDAKSLKPTEHLPDQMIAKIDSLIAGNEREMAAARLKEEAYQKSLKEAQEKSYNDAMATADKAFSENDLNTAKSGYEAALKIKVADPTAKQKLGQTEAKLAQLAKMTQAYNTAINDANRFVGDRRYQEAKGKYQEALQYLPDSDYPKQQIKKLDELLAQAETERQKDESYTSAVKEGENFFKNKEYPGARLSFVKASELKPDEALPVRRIREIDKILAELAAVEAKNKAEESGYQETINRADKALANKEYSSARLIYGEALSIKPNDQYPKGKIAEIDQVLADLKVQQYNQAIAAGDLAFKGDQLDEASKQYELALTFKTKDAYAQKQLTEIAKRRAALLAEKANQKKLETQYESLLADAGSYFKSKEYQKSKEKYQSALLLKPEETLPKEQIAKIDGLLKEISDAEETNRLYTESVKTAQEAFRQNKLKEARDAYLKAHDYKPSEPMPPIRIAEINTMINQLEETAKLTAQEEAQRLAKEKADKEQYNKIIADADKSFSEKQYKIARNQYTNAISILPNEKYPKSQIVLIDELIAKQEEMNALARQQAMKDSIMKVRDEAFNKAIASAKELELNKQYHDAILKYKSAIIIKPEEKSKIEESIASLEDQLKLMESQDKQYNQLIARADQLYASAKLEDALAEYRNATNIKSDEAYPKKQIVEIQRIIAERNTTYNNAIKNGDQAFTDSDWQKAKAAYIEALTVKPAETYPENRLKEVNQKIIDEKLAGIGDSAALAAYNDALAKGEKALLDNQLTTAKMHFTVAQSLKPSETLPPQRIKEIDALIEQRNKERLAQSQRETDEKYRQSISVADNAFREKTYTIARLRYQEAQLIKPDESYPKNQILLIDKLLKEAQPVETYAFKLPEIKTPQPTTPVSKPEESAVATETRAKSFKTIDNYDEAISKADGSFGVKDYTVARFYYYKASDLKPNEEYPKNQIELIRKLVDSELSATDRSDYDRAIGQADAAFGKQNYSVAKFFYYKALEIKSWEKYPKDRINEILALTHSLLSEKEEKEYRDVIAKADEAYFAKDIGIARFYYNKAIAIKPGEDYPGIKLKDIQKLIDQDNQDQQKLNYNKLIELADQAMQSENYSIARFNYNKALSLLPDEKYPVDQLKRIKEALDKQKKE